MIKNKQHLYIACLHQVLDENKYRLKTDLDYRYLTFVYFCIPAGELGKLEMLHEGILHKCIKQLLEKKKNIPLADMSEDLECLCHLMRTVGRRLDTNKAKVLSGILF